MLRSLRRSPPATFRRRFPLLAVLGCLLATAPFSARAADWQQTLRSDLNAMAEHLTATLKPWPVPARTFHVEDYGALPDGKTVNTAALQKAIDACAVAGGGRVLFPKGDYVTGTLELKSGVMLQIDKDARLLGSLSLADYPDKTPVHPTVMDSHMHQRRSLLYAEACERVGLCGEGAIDGRGTQANFPGPEGTGPIPDRPFLIRMIECRQVVVDGIHLRSSAGWMENYLNCDDLIFQGLHVENQANWNNDGIDLDGCRNVIVRDCFIDSEDDGLCFKGAGMRTMENVLVENSKFYSTCNAIKFGTDSQGGFRNVLIRHVETGGPAADLPVFDTKQGHRAISGVSWESTDGGTVENVLVTDTRIVRAEAPVFLYVGQRGRVMSGMAKPAPGQVRRIMFEHISGDHNGALGSAIVGLPGAPVRDVAVNDYRLFESGGGTAEQAARVPTEQPTRYPEASMFGGNYPAFGFWIRHADGVSFSDFAVTVDAPDTRPCLGLGGDAVNIELDGQPFTAAPAASK